MSQSNDSGLNLDTLLADYSSAVINYAHYGGIGSYYNDLVGAENAIRATLANQPAPTDWQAAHADMVKRNALLRERPDLPADRIPAHAELVRLQEENARLRANQPAPTVRVVLKPIPLIEIGSVLANAMQAAVQNGANSISMPDEYVAIAHFIAYPEQYAHQPAQEQAERCTTCDGTGMVHRADGEYLGECTNCAQQEPVAAPDRKLDPEAMRAIRRAVRYLEENDCTGPAEDLKALLDPLAAAQLDGGQEGSAT